MKLENRTQLLKDIALNLRVGEAENVQELQKHFFPLPSHSLALRPEIVVVSGGRGAGKSALYSLIKNFDIHILRRLLDDSRIPDSKWVDCFSQTSQHPDVSLLDLVGASLDRNRLRSYWMGNLFYNLLNPYVDAPISNTSDKYKTLGENLGKYYNSDIKLFTEVAHENLGIILSFFDDFDKFIKNSGLIVFATYDHLDRIGTFDAPVRQKYISALLALWLSFSNRYAGLRAKIFLRDDLFQATESDFPDATKLRARSVPLDWDTQSLYQVSLRYLVNASPAVLAWLQEMKGIKLSETEFGWMPGKMTETEQKLFASRLAGEFMGSDRSKGYTYRWITNHLQDSHKRVVPRSILNLLGFAAENAQKNPIEKSSKNLLRPSDLVSALEKTSVARVAEIKEESKLVGRLANLKGEVLLMPRKKVVERLSLPLPDEIDKLTTDGEQVFQDLINLGVLSLRSDGKVDVPDIYRSGFGIKRMGGAARSR